MSLRFETEQWLPYPVDVVFAFFVNPRNLPRLLPRWQQARLDYLSLHPGSHLSAHSSTAYIAALGGTRIALSFRPVPFSPIRISWLAEIEDFHWNERFCDVQVTGPFSYWRQCHSVQAAIAPSGLQGTLLRDVIDYDPPLGRAGALADPCVTRPQIAGLFRYRHKRTTQLLPAFVAKLSGARPDSADRGL
jgi:ligand-binding SRPBCC domain-containing protein